jgi:cysteine desulfurase/selenocysteine lyase
VTGTVIDLTAISQQLRNETLLVVDASQAIVHRSIDVEQLGVDALYFTGHKLGAHTGIGVLWARKELLEQLPPATGGGGMVDEVTTTGFTLQSVPDRFEAGTPNLV